MHHTGVIYFARGHEQGPHTITTADAEPATIAGVLEYARQYRQGTELYTHLACSYTAHRWGVVKDHVAATINSQPSTIPYHLWLEGTVIRTNLSRFEAISVKVNKKEAERLFKLNGRVPMQLVLQRADRTELLHVAREGGWRVHPALLAAVDKCIKDYHGARAPLYPLSKIKRLGYLDENDELECEKDLVLIKGSGANTSFDALFRKGHKYPIRTHTVQFSRTGKKPNAVNGEIEDVVYTGLELGIFLKVSGQEYAFMDGNLRDENTTVTLAKQNDAEPRSRFKPVPVDEGTSPIDFTLQELCDHFVIPDVPDVAAADPAGYQRGLAELERLEAACGFKLKLFQKQDLARSALHQGLIMGWDTGLGKTWTLYLLPLLQRGYTLPA